ncbi:hypothetical protein L2E82_07014 [Cichorium intybus]|uniref:Uncharacterized protein n=1 Tax=Cichorium intybus TaxID=13427 RepID=A0ACB9G480_CICIN|nr:hypothetical protein L2E82_07014 [Cichorium intybus]
MAAIIITNVIRLMDFRAKFDFGKSDNLILLLVYARSLAFSLSQSQLFRCLSETINAERRAISLLSPVWIQSISGFRRRLILISDNSENNSNRLR